MLILSDKGFARLGILWKLATSPPPPPGGGGGGGVRGIEITLAVCMSVCVCLANENFNV